MLLDVLGLLGLLVVLGLLDVLGLLGLLVVLGLLDVLGLLGLLVVHAHSEGNAVLPF